MRLHTGLLCALALCLPTLAQAAPRALDCDGAQARAFLAQAVKGRQFSGWGSATPKRGVVLAMNDAGDRRKGGRGVSQRRDGWNALHVVRYHAKQGANVSLTFSGKVTTDTLVQMCTYDIPYEGGVKRAKLVGAPKATLKFNRNKFANVRAPATRNTQGRDRLSLVWVSPASSVAAGQAYSVTVGPCAQCRANSMVD